MRCVSFLAVAAGAVCASMACASPITYSITDAASGSVGSTAFVNQKVTISFMGDTADLTGSEQFVYNPVGTGEITIGDAAAIAFTDPIEFFVSQSSHAAGIALLGGGSILDVYNGAFATYAGDVPLGPLDGSTFYRVDMSFATAMGDLQFTSAGSSASFVATTSSGVTPEPSALLLLATGLLVPLGLSRRRWGVMCS